MRLRFLLVPALLALALVGGLCTTVPVATAAPSPTDGVVASAPPNPALAGDVGRQPLQRTQGGRHGQRQLGARSEARMGRNGLRNRQLVANADAQMPAHVVEIGGCATRFRTVDMVLPGPADGKPRRGFFQRHADSAEPARGLAAGIEKSQMQASGRRDVDDVVCHFVP